MEKIFYNNPLPENTNEAKFSCLKKHGPYR
jgi:hypothetical protein